MTDAQRRATFVFTITREDGSTRTSRADFSGIDKQQISDRFYGWLYSRFNMDRVRVHVPEYWQ